MAEIDLTTRVLRALALEAPEVEWSRHSATVATELAPALELQLASMEPARQETHLRFMARDLAHEAGTAGARAAAAIQNTALDARLAVFDGWITSATRRIACDGEPRAGFEARAAEIERELMALDDRLRATRPAARDAVSEQLSEMYLDLEYVQTGIDGSFRLARLLDALEEKQGQEARP